MHLPESICQLVGEFVLSFPKLDKFNQDEAKKKLAHVIASSYNEYIDVILDDYKIPYFKDLKMFYNNAVEALHRNAERLISQYKLGEYRDIIMENYSLTVPKLIFIAEYCYKNTKNIDKACQLYCALGYPTFDYRSGNEEYLLNFINAWVDFVIEKGGSKVFAQLGLLCAFVDMDSVDDAISDAKFKKSIYRYFPFSIRNIEKLIDVTLTLDNFESDSYKQKFLNLKSDLQIDFLVYEEKPRYSILCNYYIYIFNKVNGEYPLSAFAVCAYSKWLTLNISVISEYFHEISSSEIQSLLFDYALDKVSYITTIPEDSTTFLFHDEYETVVEMMYKLHYKTGISNYELIDLWVYFVVNRTLTYSHHNTHETASILQVSPIGYDDNGNILLPWKYVRFVDGKAFFYHPNHEKGNNSTLPFKFETEKSKSTFSDLSKSILWNFPFISCRSENGKITEIDEQLAHYVINEIAYIHQCYLRRKIALNSSYMTARDILLHYKSEQLEFLNARQVKSWPVIPVLEITSNTMTQREEPALLFTVAVNSYTYTLVYESVTISKASYIFIVDHNAYDQAVKRIISYFTSSKPNKRAELQYSRDMFNRQDGFLRVIRVIHDDYDNWQFTINFYSKKENSSKK